MKAKKARPVDVGGKKMRITFRENEENDRRYKVRTMRIVNTTEFVLKKIKGIVRPDSRDAAKGFTQHSEDGRTGKSFYSQKK